jgi:RNA recognition motif-containing protein
MPVLLVRNLSLQVEAEHLIEIFSTFGFVTRAMISMYNNISKGYGFIEYNNHSDAATAFAFMNGGQIDGSVIEINLVNS